MDVSKVSSSNFAKGLPGDLRCNCLQLGGESFFLCNGNRCVLFHWEVHVTVCMKMAWSSAHRGLCSVAMYASELKPSKSVDKEERSCSYLEIGEQKLS